MVSHPEVNRRLQQFVCVRLDHEQMKRLTQQGRLVTPTQGNQVLLDPQGEYISGTEPRGRRYDVDELVRLLDRVLAEYPPDAARGDDLRLEWFLNNPERYRLPRHFGPESIARLDRKPLLTLSGPLPEGLDTPQFLRAHVRQFVWTRGDEAGAARVAIRQLEPEPKKLASIELDGVAVQDLARLLDEAWLQYMQQRPLVARGYIDNQHGNWLRRVMERAHQEEQRLRAAAEAATLLPPGRQRNEGATE